MIIVSACLLGVKCRFDGESRPSEELLSMAGDEIFIPLCPEQIGGLPTPRSPARIYGGDGRDVLIQRAKVINEAGINVTDNFIRGAENVLTIVNIYGIKAAIMKEKSPSCGVFLIKRDNEYISGMGVSTALLKQHGVTVISSDRIHEDYVRYHRHWK